MTKKQGKSRAKIGQIQGENRRKTGRIRGRNPVGGACPFRCGRRSRGTARLRFRNLRLQNAGACARRDGTGGRSWGQWVLSCSATWKSIVHPLPIVKHEMRTFVAHRTPPWIPAFAGMTRRGGGGGPREAAGSRRIRHQFVIPAKAGIHIGIPLPDPAGMRGRDGGPGEAVGSRRMRQQFVIPAKAGTHVRIPLPDPAGTRGRDGGPGEAVGSRRMRQQFVIPAKAGIHIGIPLPVSVGTRGATTTAGGGPGIPSHALHSTAAGRADQLAAAVSPPIAWVGASRIHAEVVTGRCLQRCCTDEGRQAPLRPVVGARRGALRTNVARRSIARRGAKPETVTPRGASGASGCFRNARRSRR